MTRTAFFACLALIALLAPPAQAAVEPRTVAELTAAASQIVIGDVAEVTSFWEDGLIRSRVVVQVGQYLTGHGCGTEIIELSGGTVGDETLYVSVLPVFQPGDHVLLFLGDNEIRLVESFQGAFLTDGTDVVQMAPACRRIIPESRQPLATLLAQVARALPDGTELPELAPYSGPFALPLDESRYALCGPDWTYKPQPMGENYVINANCVDGSAGNAESQRTQLNNGTAAWNNAGADFIFSYGGESSGTAVTFNNINLVYFDTTPPDGGEYVAATYYWQSGNNITECDLVFNDLNYTWWNGSGTCGGNKMDIWNVATHEFGHFLCLGDLYGGGDTQKTMYGYVNLCETLKRTLHADDIAGIIAIYGEVVVDTTPPTPNPMTWSVPPAAFGTTALSMTATTATDTQSPPVQYQFDFVSGGAGGTDSGWVSSSFYQDLGLSPNTSYTYRVNARDSANPPNETQFSTEATTYTFIETPAGLTFGATTTNSIVLNATGTFTNLTLLQSGLWFDSTTAGGDGGINQWVQVTTDTATDLAPNTSYTFQVKARNQGGVETPFSGSASQATLIETPAGLTVSDITVSSITLTATGPLTNLTVGQSGVYFDSTTPGGDTGLNQWVQTTSDTATGLTPNTSYAFQVKARNQAGIETVYVGPAVAVTLAAVPAAPTVGNPTSNTLDVDVVPGANPAETEFAIQVVTSDPSWNGKYVNGSGQPSSAAVWQTDGSWATITVQGLQSNTQYCFAVKARNSVGTETALSSPACATTSPGAGLTGDMNCDGVVNFGDINPFVQALTDPTGWQNLHPGCDILNGDINGSGTVGFDDINPFVNCLTTGQCP